MICGAISLNLETCGQFLCILVRHLQDTLQVLSTRAVHRLLTKDSVVTEILTSLCCKAIKLHHLHKLMADDNLCSKGPWSATCTHCGTKLRGIQRSWGLECFHARAFVVKFDVFRNA